VASDVKAQPMNQQLVHTIMRCWLTLCYSIFWKEKFRMSTEWYL